MIGRTRTSPEAGFTLIATLIGITAMAAMALVAVTAVRGDIPLYSKDISSKRAAEAARAGIEDYAFHLYSNPLYWTECTNVPSPNAVNQVGSTTKRRFVPGDKEAEYAIELLPATGQTKCETANPTESMIETSGQMTGSFRIRSTGYVEEQKASIVATFKRPSFLDYVYFTQRETLDPVTFGYEEGSAAYMGAKEQCGLTYEQGRYDDPIPGSEHKQWNARSERFETVSDYCAVISFKTNDKIEGPLHTNDAIAICGSPTFGREASDVIEMGAKSPGWFDGCGGGNSPNFVGTRIAPANVLESPESNSKLKTIAEAEGLLLTGQVYMCLNGATIETSTTSASCESGVTKYAIPKNGVVYVESGTCSSGYSPFTATYPTPAESQCGNIYVHGTYTGQLTLAARNDIIINGNLCRGSCTTPTGSGILGLIATNFVRVYHPYKVLTRTKTEEEEIKRGESVIQNCGATHSETKLENLNIDAAILALNHSFIVDHYNCGPELGDLNVEGAIAQYFRGTVGTTGGTGYVKKYVYDNRLRYLEPPSFIEPTGTSWVIGRETEG